MSKFIIAASITLCLIGPATADSLSQRATKNLEGFADLVIGYAERCSSELERNVPPEELTGCADYAASVQAFVEAIENAQRIITIDRQVNGNSVVETTGSIEKAAQVMEKITPRIHRYIRRNQ